MTISTCKKPLIIMLFFIAIIALLSVGFNFNNASAKNISVGGSLFIDNDNITVTGMREGLKLSSTGKADAFAKYANKLYLKEFNIKFQITETDFNSLYIAFETDHYDKSVMGNISDIDRKWQVNLTKTADGYSADLGGEGAVQINKANAFSSITEVKYNTQNKFEIISGGDTFIIDKAVDFASYKNEGYLTLGFKGIEITKKAEMRLLNLNKQNLTSSTEGMVNDATAPVLRLDKSKFTEEDGNLTDNAPSGKLYKLPIYGLDVLSTNIKYKIKVAYSAGGTEYNEEDDFEKSAAEFELKKEGFYKIKEIEIDDNNDNKTSVCEDFDLTENTIIINAKKWEMGEVYRPEITTFTDEAKLNAYKALIQDNFISNGGASHKFQFAAPETEVKCAPGIIDYPANPENPEYIKYSLSYRRVNASSWSKQDGLVFTASSVGEYEFKIQAVDRMGNISDIDESPIFKVMFEDVTPPKITVTGFPSEKYLDQSVTLPQATITDDMGSVSNKTIKVYYITDADGKLITDNEKKELVSEEITFTPEKLGWYEVVYTAEDNNKNAADSVSMTFNVIEYVPPVVDPPTFIDFDNVWNIVFLCIAGLSAIGLIVVLFIKPKEE
ncbi:MAG: hypothetical protein PHE12_03685 [Clostridia bacterium]|nr:hypothetical protein [Clostridia bacterium]